MSQVKKKRAQWTDEDLQAAMNAVKTGQLTQRAASERFKLPRTTLRNHLKTEKTTKNLGRKTVLTKEQEKVLVQRIVNYASIGIVLTPKAIRRQTFLYCEQNGIKNSFNKRIGLAGKHWLKLFLKRNPTISKCKVQFLDSQLDVLPTSIINESEPSNSLNHNFTSSNTESESVVYQVQIYNSTTSVSDNKNIEQPQQS